MASITQSIPNFFGGVSQVPDSQKGQGQVREAYNVIPDLNKGLMKRPGSQRISAPAAAATETTPEILPYAALVGATQSGTWFHYYRDEEEGSYIGQIQTDGSVNIWDADTGVPQTVTAPSSAVQSYLATVNSSGSRGNEDLQFTTIADTTFVNNRNVTVEWEPDPNNIDPVTNLPLPLKTDDHPHPHSAFVEIKTIQNGRQYGLNIHDPNVTTTTTITSATRISVQPVPTTNSAGQQVTEGFGEANRNYSPNKGHCPNVGTKVFKLIDSNGTKRNLIGRLTVTGQQGPDPNNLTDLNKAEDYTCKYTATVDLLHGGEGWVRNDTDTEVLKGRDYTITVEDHESVDVRASYKAIRPRPTPFDQQTSVSVDTILGGITNEFPPQGDPDEIGIYAEVIGNGIYIYSDTNAFVVEAQNTDLLTVINHEVNSIAELPFQCKDGFIVKVVNSNVAEDDYYLKFEGINGDGPGTWVECPAPNINRALKRDTMPIAIRRTGSSAGIATFTVEEFEYEERTAGDDGDSYDPSFVGQKINKVIHFRNRLGFLADSNIILSRPGDIGNFFINTALTVSGTDPIDISASSQYPGKLYDAIEINTGLLVFGEKQQFLLATDSDILNPETARLSNIASYNYNKNIPPFSLGTVAGFVDNAGAKSRLFVMSNVAREGEPNVNELSKPVPKLLPKDIDLVCNSRENSIVLLAKRHSDSTYMPFSYVYIYKYFNVADKQVQSSWAEWNMELAVKYMCAIGNSVYFVNSDLYLTKLNLVSDDSDPLVFENNPYGAIYSDGEYSVHLDNYICFDNVVSAGIATYNADTGKTTFDLTNVLGFGGGRESSDFNGNLFYSEDLTVVHLESGSFKSLSFTNTQPNTWTHSRIFEVDGDYTVGKVVIGAPYYSSIRLPTFFVQDVKGDRTINETRGNLVIHRVKLTFSETSTFDVDVFRRSTDAEHYYDKLNSSTYGRNIFGDARIEGVHSWYGGETFTSTVPIYLNNTDIRFDLTSHDPFPSTLISLTWEGDYSPKYYKNV